MSSTRVRASTLTKIATVLFSASLLGGYVWYSQLQSKVVPAATELAGADLATETPVEAGDSGSSEKGGEISGGVAPAERPVFRATPHLMVSSKSSSGPPITIRQAVIVPDIKLDSKPQGLDFLKKPQALEPSNAAEGIKVQVGSLKGDLTVTPNPVAENLPPLVPAAQSASEHAAIVHHKLMMGSSKSGAVRLPQVETFLDWLVQQGKASANNDRLKVHAPAQSGSAVIPSATVMPLNPPSVGQSGSPETLQPAAAQYPLEMPPTRTFHWTGPSPR